MPALPLGRTAFERVRGSMPRVPVVNFIVEKSPTEKQGMVFQSRRPLVRVAEVGSGPVRAVMEREGILGGVRLTVSGGRVYAGTSSVGDLSGAGAVSIAASATRALFAAGAGMVSWDGSTFAAVSFPDGAGVTKVVYLAGYFVALRAGTQRWYFSVDGVTWDGLDYASAENEPDSLRDAIDVGDTLVLIGTRTTEFWAKTGDANLPFQAIQQRVFEYGAIATGCASAADNTHFWIGDDGIVYRAGNVPEPISDDGHTADILASTSWAAYLLLDERHKLLCVRLDTKTLVFDITSGGWSEFETYGRPTFRASCADETIFGDDETGHLWSFGKSFSDEGVMERRLAGGFPIDGGTVGIDVLRMRIEVGQATDLIGDYVEPVIEMRVSDDLGRTWGEWDAEGLGEQGDYRVMPEWRALGSFDYPGALFEFRMTDPVTVRISDATVNEASGGRSR